MAKLTGFKHTTFKASIYNPDGRPCYRGRVICYEEGRRLWQETSKVVRMSRGDALRDAQQMSRDFLVKSFQVQSC